MPVSQLKTYFFDSLTSFAETQSSFAIVLVLHPYNHSTLQVLHRMAGVACINVWNFLRNTCRVRTMRGVSQWCTCISVLEQGCLLQARANLLSAYCLLSVSLPLALCSSMLLLRRPLSGYLSLSVTVHSCSSSLLPPFFGAFEQCSASETKFSGETKVISFVQSKLSDFRELGRLNAPPVGRNSHDAINPFSFFSPQLARLRRSSGRGDEGRKDPRSDEDYVVR